MPPESEDFLSDEEVSEDFSFLLFSDSSFFGGEAFFLSWLLLSLSFFELLFEWLLDLVLV